MLPRIVAKNSRHAGCAEEVLYLALLRTTDGLSRGVAQLLKIEDLSSNQYNVLRILRGAPEGLACGEIANRMITRDPDITRLLDRLEKRRLISRSRDRNDRRTVMARITPTGLQLLERLDQPLQRLHRKQLGHLTHEQQHQLARLLRMATASVIVPAR
ncbi:MAG TPA: MarR family transcriptional regulator [Terriglobales bacterium]|nr:MarR family transcriptional regulator [Terriglobales bacterium]